MKSEYLSIEDAKKLENYDKLQENYNKLLGKYNEEHSNVLNYQQMLSEREKNYILTNKEKDKKIKKLEEELSVYKNKQINIFEDKKTEHS